MPAELSLRRLLAVTALTPGQAALLAQRLCERLDGRRGPALRRPALDRVRFDSRGRVRVEDSGPGGEGGEAAVAGLLAEALGRRRRLGPAWRAPAAVRLGTTLDSLGSEGRTSPGTLAAVRRAAGELLGESERPAVEAELGALVERLTRPPAAAPGPSLSDSRAATAAVCRSRPRRPGLRAAGPVLACLLGVGLLGAVLGLGPGGPLGGELAGLRRSLPRSGLAGPPAAPAARSRTSGPGAPEPGAVPRLGPAEAGPVRGLDLRPLNEGCAPAARCQVRVYVRFQPAPAARRLAWRLDLVDRCSGAVTGVGGSELQADPGAASAYATSELSLPRGRALALVVVSTAPARAASPPLLLPARGATCG